MSQPASTHSLPYPVPAAVQALGQPEDIFPPSDQRSSLGTMMGAMLAVLALLLFGIGGMLVYCAIKPFGTNPPPPPVCLGVGGGLLLLAFGSAFGCYYYLSGKGDRRETYLIFPQALVEILPAQHRIIPWEGIREKMDTSTAAVAALRSYRFSAGTSKDVTFDASLPRHEELAALLRLRRGQTAAAGAGIPNGAAASGAARPPGTHTTELSRPTVSAETIRAPQSQVAGMDDLILANPKQLMQPMNGLVQAMTQGVPPQCSLLHLIADVRTENGKSCVMFTHGSPLEPDGYTALVPDSIAHASFAVIDPLLRLDASFTGFELLLRKTSPEKWNLKFHRLDQPGVEFSDLPRLPIRLCGHGLTLVPLMNTTFRWMRNTNPPGIVAAARTGESQPVKQVQVILSDKGSQLGLGQGVKKAEEVVEISEGPVTPQWIIETPLFRAAWPNGLDLRSPLASKTRFDLVAPQSDGTLVFVQGPSRYDECVLDTMAAEGQKEAARGKASAGHSWIELGYEFQGSPWRQRHYAHRVSAGRGFVVTAQCPQTASAAIFVAADELTDSLTEPRYS